MEAFFTHGDMAYVAECLMVTENTQEKHHSYSGDIQRIIDKHRKYIHGFHYTTTQGTM
jgi:hypothetical protein